MAEMTRRTARHAGSTAATRGRRGGGRLADLDVYDDDQLDPEDSHGGEGAPSESEAAAAAKKAEEDAAKKAEAKRKRDAEAEAKRRAEEEAAAAAREAARGGGAEAKTATTTGPASLQKLTILPWNTTDELWSIYDRLAIELDEAGHPTAVAPLIRAVLEANLPDFTTEQGRGQAIEYAAGWKKHRGQGVKEHHASNIRIKRSTQIALKDVQRTLRKEGTRVDIGAIVSGILNSHIPTLNRAIALLDG